MKKIVSKFDPFWIAQSIVMLFPLFFIGILLAAHIDVYFEKNFYLVFTIFIILAFNYLVCHKLVQISVTEKHIAIKDLLLRISKQIDFDEIEGIMYDSDILESNPRPLQYGGTLKWSDTRRKYLGIKIIEGGEFWFSDNKYKNFEEIHDAIVENMNKKSM